MSTIVNTDKLTFILTTKGLQRVAQAMEDPTVNLNISKIKVGDANGEYYVPTEGMSELVNPIEDGSFYVIEKELLEDGITTSFHAVFPETFGNCDIREVGLYETIDGVDTLFAIGTQQPFVKPSAEYDYFISVDYYIYLKSANLASVYDQIILDPDNQLVTEQDLQDLMSTILFTQGNLSSQIGNNSRIIGLDRATTLYELMTATAENYGYSATYENYATLLNYINPDNVFGYWIFNYPRRTAAINAITDISKNKYNFSCDQAVNLYTRNYVGLMPMLDFTSNHYYYLSAQVPLVLVDENNQDISFTMVFALKPNSLEETRTLLAKSNYATGAHAFEVNELTTGAIEVKLFSDSENYMTFTSNAGLVKANEAHSLILSYNSTNKTFNAYLNGSNISLTKEVTGTYTHINITPTILYAFTYTPFEAIYSNKNTAPLTAVDLFNKDGSPYTGVDWTIKDGVPNFGKLVSSYDSTKNTTAGPLYAWTANDGVEDHTIFTREETITTATVLYNQDFSIYTGVEYTIIQSGSSYVIQYIAGTSAVNADRDSLRDVAQKTMYAWVCTRETVAIWANDSTQPTVLLNSSGDSYTGTDWTVNNYVVTYKGTYTGTYTPSRNISLQTLGSITSYVIDEEGSISQAVNSNVGLVSIIREELTDDEERAYALELEAQLGKNPCFSQ